MSEKKRLKAYKQIQKRVYLASGVALIPIPILDLGSVTAVQIELIRKLCSIYDIDFDEGQVKAWIVSLVGGAVPRMAASLTKTIPVIGSVIGGVSMATLSGASTYAVGHVFADHFDKGGGMDDFDLLSFRTAYKERLKQGKKMVSSYLKSRKKRKQENIADQLKELEDMLTNGVVTEEEFQAVKKHIIAQL